MNRQRGLNPTQHFDGDRLKEKTVRIVSIQKIVQEV